MDTNQYRILKTGDQYTDTITIYGIAHLIDHLQADTSKSVVIQDKHSHYVLTSESPLKKIEDVEHISPMFHLLFRKTEKKKKYDHCNEPRLVIDLEVEKARNDQRKSGNEDIAVHRLYHDFQTIMTLKGSGTTDRKIFTGICENQDEVKQVVYEYLDLFRSAPLKRLYATLRERKLKFGSLTHLQVTDPYKSKGIHKKHMGEGNITVTSTFYEWMKWIGLTNYVRAFTEDDYNVLILYALLPHHLSLHQLTNVLTDVYASKSVSKTYGKRRKAVVFNTLLKTIIHRTNPLKADEGFLNNIRVFNTVKGLIFNTFMNFGRTYGPIHFHSLKVPQFIRLDRDDPYQWTDALENLNEAIGYCNEKTEQLALVLAYHDFISSEHLDAFLTFCSRYARLRASNQGRNLHVLAPETLDVFIRNMRASIMKEIVENEGFKSIAKAIKNATVNGMILRKKVNWEWTIYYTLAHDLAQSANTKESFVSELMGFIQSYNKEIARNIEKGKASKRKMVTEEDLDAIVNIIERYDQDLVCKLLLAYGTAKKREENVNENGKQN